MKNNNLITDSVINEFNKIRKNNLVILIVFAIIFSILVACTIVFATYETKTLFCIAGSLICSVVGIVVIFLISKEIYIKNYVFRLEYINSSAPKQIKGKIEKVGEIITLQNNDKVKEIIIINKEQTYCCYLFDFIQIDFENNKDYVFDVVDDFIKGVSYEG